MAGTEDVIIPPENALLLVRSIPHAQLVNMRGGGHGMMYQFPQKIGQHILGFLDG
jgi:pimeloyl-ACP methyl ester carboxylesterase